MPEENIEFQILEAESVGSDTVVFRLEDGAMVRIRVDIERAAVATNYRNPDGTPRYNIGAGLRITVIPSDKKFYVPKSQLQKPLSKEPTMKPI